MIIVSVEAAVLGALYHRTHTATFATAVFLVLCGLFVARIRKAQFASGATSLSLLGLPVFSYLLLRSKLSYGKGEVELEGKIVWLLARTGERQDLEDRGSGRKESDFWRCRAGAVHTGVKTGPGRSRSLAATLGMVYLTRKAEFSASHYYHNPAFTAEENQRIFGKCNNPNGHGHNYTLEVTVKGEVDPRSGFVVDLKQLKDVLNREVLDGMDHRFLNKEVPEFLTRIPTTENLAIVIWQRLAPQAEDGAIASRARVRNAGSVRGFLRRSMKAHLTRRYRFSASHRLHSDAMSDEENAATYGKCNNPHGHGHNYVLEVTVSGPVDNSTGMVCNLVDLDGFVQREIVDRVRSAESEYAAAVRAGGSDHRESVRRHPRYFAARLPLRSS